MKIQVAEEALEKQTICFHCGSACEETLWLEEKSFCCYGCKTVFEILSANDLCEYYALDESRPGVQQKKVNNENYAYLDEPSIRKKIITFESPDFCRVQLYLPAIHCVSCIWLLENLQKLSTGVVRSEVNFSRKVVTVDYNPSQVKLSVLAAVLASVGYAPQINLENEGASASKRRIDRSLVIKLAVAGFCFGNVMLFSFPEYLGLDAKDHTLQRLFSYLNIALSIPVFFYSGIDYFTACYRSIKEREINIDVPIAIGLLALFLRSTWDIVTGFGPGYLDSFTGLVFFLLIGRWFQSKTYESLAFDRDFKSYFPLAIQKLEGGVWKAVVIYDLKKGDTIKVRNMEIVPADSILIDDEAFIDYSFVTGESKPVRLKKGEGVYAGGRFIGQSITLVVDKKTSQSHLTSLWNNSAFQKTHESKYKKIIDRAARRFTWVVMCIAVVTGIYYQLHNPSQTWLVLTAVLMVACPCALALAAPFTYGSMLRVFGRHKLYLKNADIIERLATVNAVVFDKTGTVTHGEAPTVEFVGDMVEETENAVKHLTSCSTHPLSTLINKSITRLRPVPLIEYKEIPGKGIEGRVGGKLIRLGAASFVGYYETVSASSSKVFVSIDNEIKGYYKITTSVRTGFSQMVKRLGDACKALLSGDNDADCPLMKKLFGFDVDLMFNQSPHDKLRYIQHLQEENYRVLMVGDGLNDSGALKQSDVGIAVTDDTGVFTPACDAILQGDRINSLDKFLELSKTASVILKTGFVISFMYNAIALSFAVSGHLTPLVAAILMPISSISVVGFTTLAVNFVAKRKKL